MSLADAQWARIEPLLPDRTPRRGGRWRDHRQVIDAIAFKYRTGTPWMDHHGVGCAGFSREHGQGRREESWCVRVVHLPGREAVQAHSQRGTDRPGALLRCPTSAGPRSIFSGSKPMTGTGTR
ncbi:transposase [Streptomyces collinus]|uniref:transposase n=1 Tax=Streptomyces collinus TaxID=42684 RepID=UPI003687EBFC